MLNLSPHWRTHRPWINPGLSLPNLYCKCRGVNPGSKRSAMWSLDSQTVSLPLVAAPEDHEAKVQGAPRQPKQTTGNVIDPCRGAINAKNMEEEKRQVGGRQKAEIPKEQRFAAVAVREQAGYQHDECGEPHFDCG
jgi:hypothetical protein